MSLGCITITGFTGVCDSIPTFTNLVSNEKNPIRIHPSTDNYILNINAAQMVEKGESKSNQIASNGVIHFVDEVWFFFSDLQQHWFLNTLKNRF